MKAIPGLSVDFAQGQSLAKREWLAAFDGAFHARRHARSDGRVAAPSVPGISITATTSAVTSCLRLTAIGHDVCATVLCLRACEQREQAERCRGAEREECDSRVRLHATD